MSDLYQHWSIDPFVYLMAIVIAIHLRGLRARLAAINRAGRPSWPWIQQAALFYCGVLILLVAITSPVDYWAQRYLTLHVVQHLLLSFFAPPLIVLGAPWLPLLRGLPKPLRRALGVVLQCTRSAAPSRSPRSGRTRPGAAITAAAATRVRRLAGSPITSVALFNASMVFWHLPGPFDLAERNSSVHIWLEHSSFFLFGLALWLQVFGSYPLRPVLDGPRRIAALIGTNAVMVLVAMTLVMFTRAAYPAYAAFHPLAERAADQQIAGALLWVCGEVTFLPAILYTVSRWLDGAANGAAPSTTGAHTPVPNPAPPKSARKLFIH